MSRKPIDHGFMFRTLIDTADRVLLNAEICEDKTSMQYKQYNATWGKATGCTLRLVEPYFDSGRIVIGDSYFASVKTARALYEHGLFFVGCVK